MTRISLKEAYDNRDVIAQLVSLRDDVDELLNILKDIDPDGDLTNVVTKTGDQTIDGVKTFIGKIVANCDIIQNGAAYETHAEQLYTTKDYIVTRDGALGGLQPGEFSGFRVNKYDSVHDGHLVMDMNGVARVGDVNDEQPLATRDEAADMTSGALVKWDGVNMKLIAPNSNIGTDVKPIKIVNGEAVAVTNDLVSASDLQEIRGRKTFIQNSGTPVLAVKDSRKTNGVTPGSQLDTVIQIVDSADAQIGSVRQVQFPDGAVRMAINAFAGSNSFALNLQINSAGTVTLFGEKTVGGVYSSHTIDTW